MSDNELALLHQKVDHLTGLLEEQHKRQQAFDELQRDLIPIANHAIKLTIDELAEIGMDFQLEDLLFLLKRLLRNTHLLLRMMDQLESVSALVGEAQLLGPQMFNTIVETLDRLEREGYFGLARGGWYMLEQIAAEFDEEDVRALGDNVVTILKTVRSMTQPEVMNLADDVAQALQTVPPTDERVSLLALARELNDPQVRRGLARLLNVVKVMADEPAASKN
jgi:uncharacterized protein YjgD (DUF1641 family)